MLTPFRHIAGHLLWSTSGTVWVVWRVTALTGGYLPARVRQELLGKITSLVRSMPAMEPRLFVLAARTDPGEVAERMVEGLNWQRLPAWAQTCAATVDLLTGQEMHERTLWLAVPLPGRGGAAARSLGALYAEFTAALGIAPVPVSQAEVRAAQAEASRVQTSLGGGLGLQPASPAEIVWMLQHALHRGLEEPLLSDAEHSPLYGSRVHDGQLHSPSYADLGQVRIAEGGQDKKPAADGEGSKAGGAGSWWRSAATASPVGRKWLQVETEAAGTGYQAHLVLAEIPPAVSVESADVLAQLEGLPFPVDVTADLRVVPAKKARAQVQRKKRELLDQAEQYGAQPTGMPHSLPDAAGDLAEQDARMARTSVEVEVQSVTVLTVWGPDAATCDARARELSAALSGADYRAVRPRRPGVGAVLAGQEYAGTSLESAAPNTRRVLEKHRGTLSTPACGPGHVPSLSYAWSRAAAARGSMGAIPRAVGNSVRSTPFIARLSRSSPIIDTGHRGGMRLVMLVFTPTSSA
ncbi:hypothetical protein [Streptomyces sp. NPDC051364]